MHFKSFPFIKEHLFVAENNRYENTFYGIQYISIVRESLKYFRLIIVKISLLEDTSCNFDIIAETIFWIITEYQLSEKK